MDDIIVYGKSAEEHDDNVQNTCQVIKEFRTETEQREVRDQEKQANILWTCSQCRGCKSRPRKDEGNYTASSAQQCARTTQTDWHD